MPLKWYDADFLLEFGEYLFPAISHSFAFGNWCIFPFSLQAQHVTFQVAFCIRTTDIQTDYPVCWQAFFFPLS